MSWRVMETLRQTLGENKVEVYSVDEAFVDLDGFSTTALWTAARNVKETVEKWTGIKVSVGAAPTRVLAKLANRLSKKIN
jgi:DNA polymerase V